MLRYIAKRILILIPTLMAVIFIIFGIMELTPGEPARLILGNLATQEAVDQLTVEMEYDKPFIVRYVKYMTNVFRFDLGNSWRSGRPVFDEVLDRFPVTIKLSMFSVALAIIIGIPLGVLSAVKQYSLLDIAGTTMAIIMASLPSFWLGMMAIILFSLILGWLPSSGTDSFASYIMPGVTLAFGSIAALLRLTRTTMLETIRTDYIRTARAKGQTEFKVIKNHALPNALLPIITITCMEFCGLLGGVATVEIVFSINGVGRLIIDSIHMKDIPLITGSAIFLAFTVTIMMLVIDILYAYIDPRIKARYTGKRH